MKTTFRQMFFGASLMTLLVAGTTLVYAQGSTPDPCTDASTVYQTILDDYQKKDIPTRKKVIETAKSWIEKYSNCDGQKDQADWVKANVPKWEKNLASAIDNQQRTDVEVRFDQGMKAKNWDQVYAAAKEALAKWPEDYRPFELVLGSIGLDESQKGNPKFNDDTIKFAKQGIADLEANKPFQLTIYDAPTKSWKKVEMYGYGEFNYGSKNNALGWLNYTVGYLLTFDKKQKKEGADYLYKVTKIDSKANTAANIYSGIASYYVDQLNAEITKLKALPAVDDKADSTEVKQQKTDALKAQVGILRGVADRALDAYARAYEKAGDDPKQKAYKDGVLKSFKDIYEIRYEKPDGADALIKTIAAKPMVAPSTPIAPVVDEPTTASETVTPPTTPTPAAPKPSAVPATKPAAKTVPAKPSVAKVRKAAR
ncbi:MAG: hypothetical protein HS105_03500 [Chloracidobacterium sp.]|nr:hypothetical protein [Chloracidobacterium sp.]MCC6825391.1 hypothetical protein [Acidobacteriota bacterium]